MGSMGERPRIVKIFYCCAYEDKSFEKKLRDHLSNLRKQGRIKDRSSSDIKAGQNQEEEIDKYINTADIVLLLISANFIKSDYWHSVTQKAIARHTKKEAKVIPILLKPVHIAGTPFSRLPIILPETKKPITKYKNQEQAYEEIVKAISSLVHKILGISVPIDERPALNNGQTRNRPGSNAPTPNSGRGQAGNRSNGRTTIRTFYDTGDQAKRIVKPIPSTFNKSFPWEEIRDIMRTIKFPGVRTTYKKLISQKSLNSRYGKGWQSLGWILFLILDVIFVSFGVFPWNNFPILTIFALIFLSFLFILISHNKHLLLNVPLSLLFGVAWFRLGTQYISNIEPSFVFYLCVCLFLVHVALFKSTR